MATLLVRKDGSGTHTTIQSAIMASVDGDIIDIEAGLFEENIDLYKGVTLRGAGKNLTTIQGSHKANVVKSGVRTSGSNIINFSAGTEGFVVGRIITSSGVPANTRIVQVNPTSIVISANATTNGTSNCTMAQQNDGAFRMRGANGVVEKLKIVGYNGPSPESPGVEFPTLYLRNTGLGSAACSSFLIDDCEIVSNGESAILSDFAAAVGNGTISNCIISGKTFTGDNPSIGNQYSVANVPRVLVYFGSVNLPISFINNSITAITGGLTVDGQQSYNTAVTVDTINAVITGNSFAGDFGTGFALRARGYEPTVSNNTNNTSNPNAGFYVLPSHASNISYKLEDIVFASSRFFRCIQAHTSSTATAPVSGVDSALYWEEVTIVEVNSSSIYGIGVQELGSNVSVFEGIMTLLQAEVGSNVQISVDVDMLKALEKIANDPDFSNEQEWDMVSVIFKHNSSSKRLVSGIKDLSQPKEMKLRASMQSQDVFELHKIIIAKEGRVLLVLKRSEIDRASSYDIVLK